MRVCIPLPFFFLSLSYFLIYVNHYVLMASVYCGRYVGNLFSLSLPALRLPCCLPKKAPRLCRMIFIFSNLRFVPAGAHRVHLRPHWDSVRAGSRVWRTSAKGGELVTFFLFCFFFSSWANPFWLFAYCCRTRVFFSRTHTWTHTRAYLLSLLLFLVKEAEIERNWHEVLCWSLFFPQINDPDLIVRRSESLNGSKVFSNAMAHIVAEHLGQGHRASRWVAWAVRISIWFSFIVWVFAEGLLWCFVSFDRAFVIVVVFFFLFFFLALSMVVFASCCVRYFCSCCY